MDRPGTLRDRAATGSVSSGVNHLFVAHLFTPAKDPP
jgi:hypothetical protein